MIIALLSLVFSAAVVMAMWRWIPKHPAWRRRLICSAVFGSLCPPLFVEIIGAPYAPSIFMLILAWNDLKPDDFRTLLEQWVVVGCATFILWSAAAGLCSPHPENPRIMRRIRLAAVILSLPAWVYITIVILYPILIGATDWPAPNFFLISGCLCFLCALASMTLALISLRQGWSLPSDIGLFIWSALPLCLVMFAGCYFWYSGTFRNSSDSYGWNTQHYVCCRSLTQNA